MKVGDRAPIGWAASYVQHLPSQVALQGARRRFLCEAGRAAAALAGAGSAGAWAQTADAPSQERRTLQVGPERALKSLAAAARVARAGDAIAVDAGTYRDDVAIWKAPDLQIHAVGGRVRLLSEGAAAAGKGIWVVSADRLQVSGFDFDGAQVRSRNGAGIRLQKGSLRVTDCRFLHNEMGLLTDHDPDGVLEVHGCEFAFNQRPDGHNHNLYVGRIARLTVSASYFHHAHTGHLLKSRAALNTVYCNRLTDERDGDGSYELEFPNGGVAYVVGNVIAQSTRTQNIHLVSYGAEGYRWPQNAVHLHHNTLVNPLPRGDYLRLAAGHGAIEARANLLVGPQASAVAASGPLAGSEVASAEDFTDPDTQDYRLRRGARPVGKAAGALPPSQDPLPLRHEYVHPCQLRTLREPPHNPGAMQSMAPA